MDRTVAYKGNCFTIAFAVCASGDRPGLTFYTGLGLRDQAKLNSLFARLGDHGRIESREKFKKVDGQLWEFKSFQLRMPCKFFPNRLVVITHGFIKKGDSNTAVGDCAGSKDSARGR